MKVNAFPSATATEYLKTAQERPNSDDKEKEKSSPPRVKKESQTVSEDVENLDLDEMVKDFEEDPQAQAAGLHASVEGMGPGLKVVLRDDSGELIRRFSGPEFARLHDTSDGAGRGKILDKKY